MQILNIVPLENGAHENHTYHGILPNGWAFIPDEMEPNMENFPFGDVEVEEMEVEGIGLVPVVTKWIPGVMPEIEEPETPTDSTDLEARVTALESAIERGLSL